VRGPFARCVRQDAPHHLRRHGKERRALLPFDLRQIYQAETDFMDRAKPLQGGPAATAPSSQ
jgi:hypothetical protein